MESRDVRHLTRGNPAGSQIAAEFDPIGLGTLSSDNVIERNHANFEQNILARPPIHSAFTNFSLQKRFEVENHVKTPEIRALNHSVSPPVSSAETWPGFVTQPGIRSPLSRKRRPWPDPHQTDLWAGKLFALRSSVRFPRRAQTSAVPRRPLAQRHRRKNPPPFSSRLHEFPGCSRERGIAGGRNPRCNRHWVSHRQSSRDSDRGRIR